MEHSLLVAGQQVRGCSTFGLFMDNDVFVTLRAADRATSDQRREDHVLERIAVAQGEPGAILDHAVQDKRGGRKMRRTEAERAIWADQFNRHEWSPCQPDKIGTVPSGCKSGAAGASVLSGPFINASKPLREFEMM